MGDEPDRTEELLRRAKRLEERANEEVSEADSRSQRSRMERFSDGVEDVAWLARGVRRVRELLGEARQVITQIARYLGPVAKVLDAIGSAVVFVAHRASHVRVSEDDFDFSPKKTARSLLALLITPMVLFTIYNLSTRDSGVFLINDKHLVSGETDEYQMGGCWQRTPDQSSCLKGEGVIVLVRPAWIPETGIFSVTYDEDVGVIPLQGKCELGTYGIYLRTPWLPFLRGALKPIAIDIGKCDSIANLGVAP